MSSAWRMRFHLAQALWASGKRDQARALAVEARAAAAKVIADHGNTRELDEIDAWLAAPHASRLPGKARASHV